MASKSRPQRWMDAIAKASAGLEELIALKEEYEEWKDNMSDNLQGGATYEKLEEISNLDLEGALDIVQEAEAIELPRGFGRD